MSIDREFMERTTTILEKIVELLENHARHHDGDPPLDSVAFAAGVKAGREQMRRECAKVCDNWMPQLSDWRGWNADEIPGAIAEAIRAVTV